MLFVPSYKVFRYGCRLSAPVPKNFMRRDKVYSESQRAISSSSTAFRSAGCLSARATESCAAAGGNQLFALFLILFNGRAYSVHTLS
jgi:hypothetical protein